MQILATNLKIKYLKMSLFLREYAYDLKSKEQLEGKEPGVEAHACNPSSQEVETGGLP